MAKLRKMLGDIHDPNVIELMKIIETQSVQTLTLWAMNTVKPQLEYLNDLQFLELKENVQEYLKGNKTLKEIKPLLKEGRLLARKYVEPVECASAYAIITGLAVITTPTNALGFTFYHVTAEVYSKVGLKQSKEEYDVLASNEFKRVVQSLKKIAIRNEKNPVQVNWNC